MDVRNERRLAGALVELFYPLVEVTLINIDGTVLEIFNAFSTVKEDQECNVSSFSVETSFEELLVTGRNVRSLIHPLYEAKEVTGYLRVRYDLTHFKNLHEQLGFLIQTAALSKEESMGSWKSSIDQTISEYLLENTINIQAATAKQKRELIAKLQGRGLLDFKESSSYVASKLQISRATVYNYLKTSADFRKVRVHQIDAFTKEKFGGNPAGVVLDADTLDESTMRKIARELNVSETSFVLPSKQGSFHLRYFTPTGHEVAFCGHSTVGALYMLAKERRFGVGKSGSYQFEVETLSGMLKMEVSINELEEIQVAYETPAIKLRQTDISHEMVAKAAGFSLESVDLSFPVMYEETNKDLFLVIRSLKDLSKIECDPKSFSQFSKHHDIVALCLLSRETIDLSHQFHMRCFAPLVGIPEDPFTGSVLGGLAAYVHQLGLLSKNMDSFCVEQGHFIDRPGVVRIEFSHEKGKYHAKVFAQAVHCFSTEIHLK